MNSTRLKVDTVKQEWHSCKLSVFPVGICYSIYSNQPGEIFKFHSLNWKKIKTTEVNSQRVIKLFSKLKVSPFWGRCNLTTGRYGPQCNANCCSAWLMCFLLSLTNRSSLLKVYLASQWHISLAWTILPLCFCKSEILLSPRANYEEPAPKDKLFSKWMLLFQTCHGHSREISRKTPMLVASWA